MDKEIKDDFNIESIFDALNNGDRKFKKFLNFLLCDKKLICGFYNYNIKNSCVPDYNKIIYISYLRRSFLLYKYEQSDKKMLAEVLDLSPKNFSLEVMAFNIHNKCFDEWLSDKKFNIHNNAHDFFKYMIYIIKYSPIYANEVILSELAKNNKFIKDVKKELFANFQFDFANYKNAELYKLYKIIKDTKFIEDFKGMLLYTFRHRHNSSVISEIIGDEDLLSDEKFKNGIIKEFFGDFNNKAINKRHILSSMLFKTFNKRLESVDGFILLNDVLTKFSNEIIKKYGLKEVLSLGDVMDDLSCGKNINELIATTYKKYKLESNMIKVSDSKISKTKNFRI